MPVRRIAIFILFTFFATLEAFVGWANAESRPGTGIGLNIGAMFVTDEDVYFGEGTDLYPEVTVYREHSILRVGATAGVIWREYYTYNVITEFRYFEEEILIFPVMGRLDIRPFARMGSSSPFIGIGAGYYAALKGPQSQPALALRVGWDISYRLSTIMLEIRAERTLDEPQLGGIMATIGGYFKF